MKKRMINVMLRMNYSFLPRRFILSKFRARNKNMMIPMLPLCNSSPLLMPMNSRMIGIPPIMVPMVPVPSAPFMCPPNNISMCPSTAITNTYDSRMYGQFRHVERDYPQYRHTPFDWYQPPKQQHNVIHEDAAVITLDGAVPLADFYRSYIYGEDVHDSDSDSDITSYESEEYDQPSYEQRNIDYRRPSRPELDFDYGDVEEDYARPLTRINNYPTYNPNHRARPTTIRSSTGGDNFNDAASADGTYDN